MLKKFKLDFKLLKEMDLAVLVTTVLIVLFGIINIYAGTKADAGFSVAKKQLILLAISLVAMYLLVLWDYTLLQGYVEIFYWANIALLIFTKFFGSVRGGARGWIIFPGGFQMQPAELMKFAMILILAKKLDQFDLKINELKNFLILAAYAILPMILIVVQPDMGMTMVCFFIALGIFYCAGLDMKIIFGGLLSLVVFITIVWNTGIIEQYQKLRFTSFLDPEAYELGIGLQLTQSKIGIGSGGFMGTGVSFGSDSSRSYVAEFVPEHHTDFIFAVIGEHWGTIGATFLLILYGILIYRMIVNAREAKDIFGATICGGLASYFIFAVLQNIGMNIGIMPITGITLPLVSYGGSSLLTTIMAIALVLNISMRKKKIYF